MAPLTSIDTGAIKDNALKKLLSLLEGVRGKKSLILDRSLSGPINSFAKFSILQDYGVDGIFWLEDVIIDYAKLHKNVVFLCRATAKNGYAIAAQIKSDSQASGQDFEHSAFIVPRRTLVLEKILEEEGVLGDVTLNEFPLYFIPLDSDLLSLEFEDGFEELYLRKDYTSIFYSAKALMGLQQKYGLFPRIIGKGDNAHRLAEALIRMRKEVIADDPSNPFALAPSSTIENLIIIDRGVDFATPLLTQLTYEGLIDEVFGIKDSKVELDSSIAGPVQAPSTPSSSTAAAAPPAQKKRPVLLDSSDKLYEKIRDMNFALVGNTLNKIAHRLINDYEGRHQAKTVSEIRNFVGKLAGLQTEHQSLRLHTALAEEIMKSTRTEIFNKSLEVQQNLAAGSDPSSQAHNVEELICRSAPIRTVLRLLCLDSIVSGGLKTKDYDHYKRELRHAYGYEHMLTFSALENFELFQARTALPAATSHHSPARTNYAAVRKQLRLIVDEVDERDPDDIAYVYSGYAPLSIRLVQCVIQRQALATTSKQKAIEGYGGIGGWKGFEDVMRNVRGRTFDEVQSGEDKAMKTKMILNGYNERKTTIVFFVGGITYTEIAALRFIAKKEEGKREILICTTGIITGDKMMQAAIPKKK